MMGRKFDGIIVAALTAIAVTIGFPACATSLLVPQTKLKISVVQWIPAKSEYQVWSAVSGEFVISEAGTITLPLIGTMDVADLNNTQLAEKVAEQLKLKTGLLNVPDTTVEVLEYSPIYVVGIVAKPGEYRFRPGLTVLQALALSGGRHRPTLEDGENGELNLLGDLETVRDEILRAVGRIARLEAEGAGNNEIRFPPELTENPNKKTATEVMIQERVIFDARRNGLSRQLTNLSELRDLFSAEVSNLGKKAEGLDRMIKLAEEELTNVRSLYDKGIATAARRSDLERAVSGLHSDRLDEVTATMRARQNLSEATRNDLGLRDQRAIDLSIELQNTQSNLQRLKVKEDVLTKTLFLSAAASHEMRRNDQEADSALSLVIVRKKQNNIEEISADEATALLPGDVLRVSLGRPLKQATVDTAVSEVSK
jgi:protein involved in polysaccharide export with SLBB domain